MKAVDIIKPLKTKTDRFNAWLDWKHTNMFFKDPRSRKIFVNVFGHESEAEVKALKEAGLYYDISAPDY